VMSQIRKPSSWSAIADQLSSGPNANQKGREGTASSEFSSCT
jgi:hypothetical protein